MGFYKCYRAFVRGKVEGFKLGDPLIPETVKQEARQLARRYFLLAKGYAQGRGTLVIMVGLAGSGKSSAAAGAAELLCGKLLSSDNIRKKLAGVGPDEQVYVPFGKGIYTPEWNERTYSLMMETAAPVLASGGCAILDASFLRRHQRHLAYELARKNGARALVIECVAPEDVLRERLVRRVEEGAVSDGRPEILDGQLRVFESLQFTNDVSHAVIRTDQERESTEEDLWSIL
jgi:predicted kinase